MAMSDVRLTDASATVETVQAVATQRRVGGLSNKIHAVFRRSNFKNIPDAEYNFLKPSLQLASLFLIMPELAGFPHAVLVGECKRVPHPENQDLEEWSYQAKDSKLSSRDMAMYNLALSTFADMVVFIASKDEDLHSGSCCYNCKVPSPRNSHLKPGSVIYFSEQEHADHAFYQSEFRVKWRTFETAKIVLHEIMHAMSHARAGNTVVAFGSNKVVETGYEWESHIFGGVICYTDIMYSGVDGGESLVIRDWPAASMVRSYRHLGYPTNVLGEDPPPIEIRWWLLPNESAWFEQLFTRELWTKTVPEQGADALKPPKVRGYRVEIHDGGFVDWTDLRQEDFNSYGCTIPAGYTETLEGEIVADRELVEVPGGYIGTSLAEYREDMDVEKIVESERAEVAGSYECTVPAGHVEDMDGWESERC